VHLLRFDHLDDQQAERAAVCRSPAEVRKARKPAGQQLCQQHCDNCWATKPDEAAVFLQHVQQATAGVATTVLGQGVELSLIELASGTSANRRRGATTCSITLHSR